MMGGKVEAFIVITPAELAEVARLLGEPTVAPGAEPGTTNSVNLPVGNLIVHFLNPDSPDVKRLLQQQAQPAPRIVRASQVPPC